MAFVSLGGGREDRFIELARHFVTVPQRHAADGAGLLVFLPAGADQVAAHDAFYREQFCFFDEHGTAFKQFFVFLQFRRKIFDVGGDHMVFDNVSGAVEPELGDHVKDFTLVRDAVGHDDIKGRNAVGCDEEILVSEIVDFADLAGFEFFDSGQFNFSGCSAHFISL